MKAVPYFLLKCLQTGYEYQTLAVTRFSRGSAVSTVSNDPRNIAIITLPPANAHMLFHNKRAVHPHEAR